VTDGLPVRVPWSLVRWYRGLRPGAAATGGSPEVGAARPPVPGSIARRSLPGVRRRAGASAPTSGRDTISTGPGGGPSWTVPDGAPAVGGSARRLGFARTSLTAATSLIGVPPGGPDVRLGHELAMGPGLGSLRGPGGSTARGGGAASMGGAVGGAAFPGGAGFVGGGAGTAGGGVAGRALAPRPGDISRRGLTSPAAGEPAPVVGAGLADGLPVRGGVTISAGSAAGPVSPGPVSPGPVSPGPVSPGPVSPAPGAAAGTRAASWSTDASTSRDRDAGGGRRPAGIGSSGWGPGALGRAGLRAVAGPAGGPGAGLRAVAGPAGGPGAGRGRSSGAGAAALGGSGAALLRRPLDGPTVSDPNSAGGMRVLGAATLPPGSAPDPTGAVSSGPAAGHHIGSPPPAAGHHIGSPTPARGTAADRARGNVTRAGATPRERWETAVAARPLESPRPLPVAFHAMATAITGRARPPLFTTGPSTRSALAAAGALGATTGTVVHLPAAPTSGPAVSAVLAHELTHTKSPVRRPRFLLGGASGLLDDDERQALAAGRERLGQAASMGAGIVDSLPVGGGGMGAVGEVATRAARAAVIEASGSPMGSALSGMRSAAGDAFSDLRGMAGDAMSGLGGAAEGAASAVSDAAGSVSSAVGEAAHAAGAAIGGGVGGAAGAAKPLDPDQVVEIVERRLLREIERRGGRWTGIF
jgi:hypothetical protein